jgi:hypothetical protein
LVSPAQELEAAPDIDNLNFQDVRRSRRTARETRTRLERLRNRERNRQESNDMPEIREHMEVIGADGVHVGTVDRLEGNRIKLTRKDSGEGSHKGHHHFIDRSLVADVEGNQVRLSAVGAVAVTMEEEK